MIKMCIGLEVKYP